MKKWWGHNMTSIETVIQKVQEVIQTLEGTNPKRESMEWYSINNLEQFKDSLERAGTISDIEKADLALSRFTVDSIEWNSRLMSLMQEIEKITSEYLRQRRHDSCREMK
jgi:hypothetical protein